jgi:hypothetical protein
MTTYRAWVDYLETLAPTGVVKRFTSGPPAALNTADLPAQWLELPHGENRPSCSGSEGGDRTLFIDHVVAMEPVGQNTQAGNFDGSIDMMDNVDAALEGTFATSPLIGPQTWRSRQAIVTVGNIAYWSIVTSIEGLG